MAHLALLLVKDVIDAYVERDADKALDVWNRDEELDEMYSSLFREFLTYMMEDPRNIGVYTHLLFMAKNIERIGDHATNIAENLYYLVHGRPLDRRGRKATTRASNWSDRTELPSWVWTNPNGHRCPPRDARRQPGAPDVGPAPLARTPRNLPQFIRYCTQLKREWVRRCAGVVPCSAPVKPLLGRRNSLFGFADFPACRAGKAAKFLF